MHIVIFVGAIVFRQKSAKTIRQVRQPGNVDGGYSEEVTGLVSCRVFRDVPRWVMYKYGRMITTQWTRTMNIHKFFIPVFGSNERGVTSQVVNL